MKKIAIVVLLLLCGAVFGQTKRTATVDDLFAIKDLSDPQISPDGKWVAYVVEASDLKKDDSDSDVYMVSVQGGDAIRLTTSEEADTSPRWSPDNKYLAFFSKRSKKKQVFLMNRSGGEAVQLTDIKQGVSDFSWSPDGKKLALVIEDPDPDAIDDEKETRTEEKKKPKPIVITRLQFKFDEIGYLFERYHHIYTFDIASKAMKQITSGPYSDRAGVASSATSTPQWSPDGKWIAFVSNRTENADANRNTDIFVVSSEGGEPRKVTTNDGPDEVPSWSPDGKFLVYQTAVQPKLMWYDTTEIAVIPVTGGTPKILTREMDRNCWYPRFSADGKRIYFVLEDQGKQILSRVSAEGGAVARNIAGENVVADFDTGLKDSIVILASRPNLPYEIFAASAGKSRQLTTTNAGLLDAIRWSTMEPVQFKSKDGTTVAGFVNKPPEFDPAKKYPLILWIHGGPTAQYMEEFDISAEVFAAAGYVVLRPNPRGSTGYGEEFCKAIWADWGNKDYDDVMGGVDHVIAQGYIDPERLAVMGWSYGGMLTDHVITKSTRFKAAASGASELNYFMDYGVDHYQYEWEIEMGYPWVNPDLYMKTSPFFQINKVKTPTLIMCGESDQNVPLVNSEQMYQALRRLGVDTMLIIYPGEPHGISVPTYRKDRMERYLAWFGHYLQGAPNRVPK